ncbi:hypothetical protein [Jeotgalibacillus proteolyticus]|uniref:DUF2178 domain-containing protein n=1 Tax=Jeotgalibacillus proteolyticus TaxID=2082395 RepID=A0A2S5GCT0_9BACL|nr:hypothetical protein [Jeotgalibacillus proteolyticus]PPA70758.1 hypothetical protein C4B60_08165 [Jeotgalibacillus proteolyticus]
MTNRAGLMIALNFLALVCVGWFSTALYLGNESFAAFVFGETEEFFLSLPLTPLVVMLIIAVVSYFLLKKFSGRKVSFKATLLPPEFSEQDEREKEITARACRNAYVSLTYAVPAVIIILAFEPVFNRLIPASALWILLLIPIVQFSSYYFTIRKYAG